MGDMKGSDERVSGETSIGGEEPTGGASPVKDKAAGPMEESETFVVAMRSGKSGKSEGRLLVP